MNAEINVRIKERDSNIELLRIVAMLLVMMVHANFFTLGPPSQTDINTSFVSSFMRFFCESLCIICVNVYILISGWFGINAKAKRIIEFIFQIYFIAFFIHLVVTALGVAKPTAVSRWIHLFLIKDMWFVKSYIVFYVFTPVLNAFVNASTKKQLGLIIVTFYIVQTFWGGFISSSDFFSGGYSPLSFMGLYLLGRYIRLYPTKYTSLSKYFDMLLYFATAIVTTFLSIVCVKIGTDDTIYRLYAYSSPIVIVSSLYFFLFFSKLSLKSRIINWISISSFAAFLVHGDYQVFGPFYKDFIERWFHSASTINFIINTGLLITILFIIAILIDKIRIVVWDCGKKLFQKNMN